MTRAEILNCLTDRPCDVCRFHESGRCERWECVFEEKPDDAEDCEDAISRQAVMNLMRGLTRWGVRSEDGKFNNVGLLYDDVMFGLDRLPSVTPKQKMGHWEWVQYDSNPEIGNFHCSECNFIPASFNWASKHLNYCPNCGAKMQEVDE